MGQINKISGNDVVDKAARVQINKLQNQIQALRMCVLALARMANLTDFVFRRRDANTSDVMGYIQAKNYFKYNNAFEDIEKTTYHLCEEGSPHPTPPNASSQWEYPFTLSDDKYYTGKKNNDFSLQDFIRNYYSNFSPNNPIDIPSDSNIF